METTDTWLLLIVSLPSDSATARMRIWRTLKTIGCGALRDGAYVLPLRAAQERQLKELAAETEREGGTAWLLTVASQSEHESGALRELFSRSEAWTQFVGNLALANNALATLAPAEINRTLRKLRRDFDAIVAIDYFPGAESAAAKAAWMDYVHSAERLLSPGEPSVSSAPIQLLDRAGYQGRRWATRKRMWIDRVASAWLIRRFIDHQAEFLWLETPADCPADALGFDFDGAAFTHVGERVSFEVLLASFGLEGDPALQRLGAMVHVLDVGGGFVPEAAGFEAAMTGARHTTEDDDQLLAMMGGVLDAFYIHFSNAAIAQ